MYIYFLQNTLRFQIVEHRFFLLVGTFLPVCWRLLNRLGRVVDFSNKAFDVSA